MIPHNKPTVGIEESDAIASVVRSGWIAEGKKVEEFENAFCAYLGLGSGHARALSSGTAALYLALVALGVKKGSEVIAPTYACSALLNAIYMVDAVPVLVDIESDTLGLSIEETKKKITERTAAIIVVHTFGFPVDIEPFQEFRVPIIEDCAQALGATINGKSVGTKGDAAIFSFYATKMITTGYGGMIVSNSRQVVERVADYREFDGRPDYKPRFNFQISDMQAAMGLVQLSRLPEFLQRRAQIRDRYLSVASEILWPQPTAGRKSCCYRTLVRTPDADALKKALLEEAITAIVPIEQFELLHRYLMLDPMQFPVSESVARTSLSLPCYPSLTDKEIDKICEVITRHSARL